MHDDLVLIQVTPRSLPILEPMVRAYYDEDGLAFGEDQARALRMLAGQDDHGVAWLIRQADATVGYVVLTLGFGVESGGRDGFVDEIYLRPPARGRGLGGSVLRLVEEEARARGVRKLYLEVGEGNRAHALYRRAGFTDHRRHLMSKPL